MQTYPRSIRVGLPLGDHRVRLVASDVRLTVDPKPTAGSLTTKSLAFQERKPARRRPPHECQRTVRMRTAQSAHRDKSLASSFESGRPKKLSPRRRLPASSPFKGRREAFRPMPQLYGCRARLDPREVSARPPPAERQPVGVSALDPSSIRRQRRADPRTCPDGHDLSGGSDLHAGGLHVFLSLALR